VIMVTVVAALNDPLATSPDHGRHDNEVKNK